MDRETFQKFDPMQDDVPSHVMPIGAPSRNPNWCKHRQGFPTRREGRFNGENAGLQDALFNDRDPRVYLQSEQPWHRGAVEMAKMGHKRGEIAQAFGVTPAQVGLVLQQPWAREYMIRSIKEDVQADFKKLLEAERTENLRVLRDIRDDAAASNRDRIQAAIAIWDRDLGKPNQPLSVGATVDPATLTDKEILERLAASGATSTGTSPAAGGEGESNRVGPSERIRAGETSPVTDSETGSGGQGGDKATSDIPPTRVSEEHV